MAYNEGLIGKRERISIVNETSFGSGGDMATDGYIPGLDCKITPNWNKNWQEIISAGEDNRYVQGRVLGPRSLPFELEFTVTQWKFFQLLGYSVADAGSDPYTHTFSISNTIQSFKLEWAWRHTTPVVVTLTGCFCLGGTISFQKAVGTGNEGFVKVRLRCFANSYSIGSSVTSVSAITRDPFQWRHTKITINNSEVARINSGRIEIDNGINPEDFRYCNTTIDRGIGEPVPKVHRITGMYNITYFDDTFIDLWDSDAVISNCSADFIRDNTNNKIEIDFSNFRDNTAFSGTDFEGVKKADFAFSAESFSSLIATDNISTY